MELPYLKLSPEESLLLIDRCVVTGYNIKDSINNEYYIERTNITNEKIKEWEQWSIKWANDTMELLSTIFVSQKEIYNFRDALTSPFVKPGNRVWNAIINQIDARIQKLNDYDSEIKRFFHIQVEVVGRDKIEVSSGGQVEIKN